MGLLDWDDEESSKRSLTIREKKILYTRANGKCELCGERIGFLEMQVGHKIAASRGGSATTSQYGCSMFQVQQSTRNG